MKTVSILMRGQGDEASAIRDLEIEPGTEKGDVLKALNLTQDYNLFRRRTNEFVADGIDLHKQLENGEKLEASLSADLGASA